jgi:hypothetical protein
MQRGATIRSSSRKPASAGSSAVVRLATNLIVHAASGEGFSETRSQPVTEMSTGGEAASLCATTQALGPLRLAAHLPLFLRTAAGAAPKASASSEGEVNGADPAGAAPAASAASEVEVNGADEASEIVPSSPPHKTEEVRLEIESLKYYEVLKPIPVIVRPLGERTFEAEVPGLNISTTGSSIMGVFLSMKTQIVSIVDRYRGKKMLNPEEQRHLAAFEIYIGNARRHWYAR